MLTFIVLYYIVINIVSFFLYGIDKYKAKKGKWRTPEAVLILFAVFGGALGAFAGMHAFRHKTLKKKFTITVPVFIIVHILIIGFFAVTTLQIITYGNRHSDEKADVAIVLGAATTGKEIKPVFQERVNEAIRLYEDGRCDKILLTGGVPIGSDVADSELAYEYVLEMGFPAEDILTEAESQTTEGNLKCAKEVMDENGYESALIVSDPLHMKRAVLMAEDIGFEEVYPAPTTTSMYKSFSTRLKLLNHEEAYYVGYLLFRLFR